MDTFYKPERSLGDIVNDASNRGHYSVVAVLEARPDSNSPADSPLRLSVFTSHGQTARPVDDATHKALQRELWVAFKQAFGDWDETLAEVVSSGPTNPKSTQSA